MALQEKYQELIDFANSAGVADLQVREQDNVLYVDGDASGSTKDQLWTIYEKIDPEFRSGDLVLNITTHAGVAEGAQLKVVTNQSNLNIRSGPGTDTDVVGKAARHSILTLIRVENDQWWYIRNADGVEGFCYTQYLAPVG
jgi:hypothetical protein